LTQPTIHVTAQEQDMQPEEAKKADDKKADDKKPGEKKLEGEFDEPSETLKALAKGLFTDPPDIRTGVAAADALESMADGAALVIPGLLKGLSDWNRFVRWACTRTLGKLAPSQPDVIVSALIPILRDEDADVAAAAASALERFGVLARPAIQALVKALAREDDEIRIAVMRTLVATGSDGAVAVPVIVCGLTDTNKRVRLQAIRALATFGPLAKEAADALRTCAHADSDPEVRKAAMDALIKVLGN